MRIIRLPSGATLAIAPTFFGCEGSSGTATDAVVARLDTGSVRLDSGGTMGDTGGAGNLDSGAVDIVLGEGGIHDSATDMSSLFPASVARE